MSGAVHNDENIQTLAEFRYRLRRFLHFSEAEAASAGLTPQHHQLLLQIAGAPRGAVTSLEYLAERLVLRHNSVVELARRCEEAGLLRRSANPENYRHVVLQLSAKGWKSLRLLSEAHARELTELAPELISLLSKLAPEPAATNDMDAAASASRPAGAEA